MGRNLCLGTHSVKVRGRVDRYSETRSGVETVLLTYVEDEHGNRVSDHMWLNKPRMWDDGIDAGDVVEIKGIPVSYKRRDGSEDVKVGSIYKVALVSESPIKRFSA